MTAHHKPHNTDHDGRLPVIAAALDNELAPFKRNREIKADYIKTGMGTKNADSQLRKFIGNRKDIRCILSVGLAGALTPELKTGDLVIAENIHNCKDNRPTAELLATARKIHIADFAIYFGTALTVDRIISSPRERRALADKIQDPKVIFMDMESTAVARVCSELSIPFIIIRSISDEFHEDFPIDFNKCLDCHGNISIIRVIIAALRQPSSFTGLVDLRRRSLLCTDHLVRFVETFLSI